MRIPLLMGARGTSRDGSIVRIPPGRWRILSSGLRDSRLSLMVGYASGKELADFVDGCEVTGPVNVQCLFINRGKEEAINIIAERIA